MANGVHDEIGRHVVGGAQYSEIPVWMRGDEAQHAREEVARRRPVELPWQDCFLRIGRKDLAELVFNALMKYSITTEYYVGERYRDDTPWYYPWSPNASGSGRIIQMMLRNP